MVKYNCDTCKKVFKQKIDFDRHKNRKIKCISEQQDVISDVIQYNTLNPHKTTITQNTEIKTTKLPQSSHITDTPIIDHKLICINCNKKYSRLDSLRRHQFYYCLPNEDTFKSNNNVIELLSKMNNKIDVLQESHKQEISELKNTISKLEQKSSITTNTNSHNTTNNTINNNVIIKFGEEDAKSILSKKDIQYIVDAHKEYLLQRSIEVTHCNNKYPSLQNIYVPDKRMQMINIYNGEKYELKNIENVIMDLITTHQNNLDDYRRMKEIKIDVEKREDMEEYVDNFHRFNESSSDHKKQIYDSVINEVKLLLYNNKDKVKDTEKHQKKIKV